MRYGWEYQHQYLRQSGLERGLRGALTRVVLHYLRLWDYRTANQVDHFIANSAFVARRIDKIYRRPSTVVYPPVDVARFELQSSKEDYYLAVSRFAPYKHTETIVEAFRDLAPRRLVVIGDGAGLKRARATASANVTLLGFQSFEVLREHLSRARALIFAAEEDFGITPVEAQACGTPVIAFGGGGALGDRARPRSGAADGAVLRGADRRRHRRRRRALRARGWQHPARGLPRPCAGLHARALLRRLPGSGERGLGTAWGPHRLGIGCGLSRRLAKMTEISSK